MTFPDMSIAKTTRTFECQAGHRVEVTSLSADAYVMLFGVPMPEVCPHCLVAKLHAAGLVMRPAKPEPTPCP